MASDKPVVGIDLGGTNMQIGVVGPDDQILGRSKSKTKAEDGADAVIDRLVRGVEKACAGASITVQDLAGVGVGAPGAIDHERGVVLAAPNLGWNDFPFAQRLSDALRVPVTLDNDVNVAVVGEHRLGAGRGASDLLGVWIGTGIGGGLILNDSLYYGSRGTAGEVGHMILLPKAALGHRTLEQNCSRKHVVERMRRLVEAGRTTMLRELADDSSKIGSKLVAKAYHEDDELTSSVIDEVAEFLGASIASIVTLLSLPTVILGGGLTEALGEPFVKRVKQSIDHYVFPEELRCVKVLATKLEDNAGLLGAALLAKDRKI